MLTMPFMIPSTSASVASLKEASQTPIILCRSSSSPFSDLSSDISAPKDLKYARSSSACSSNVMSIKTGTFIFHKLVIQLLQLL